MCCMSGFLPKSHGDGLQCPAGCSGYSTALTPTQLGSSCCVCLKRSFLARNEYSSDNPDSFECMKHFWREQGFVILVEQALCTSEVLGGHCETHLFSSLCFPLTTLPAAELLHCCQRICFFYHPFSFVGLGSYGWEATTKMSCCHF